MLSVVSRRGFTGIGWKLHFEPLCELSVGLLLVLELGSAETVGMVPTVGEMIERLIGL
jgi:hypothetical protein